MKDNQRKQVHAYLDGELGRGESAQLLEAADQDTELRDYFAQMSDLRSDLQALGEMPVPAKRWTPPPAPQPMARRARRMWPQVAAAVVMAAVASVWLLSDPDSVRTPGQAPIEPHLVPVRFAMAAPAAQVVEVAGDFNGWARGKLRMSDEDGDGVWTTTVELPRGRYAYMFVIDDAWVPDPDAAVWRDDGFGGKNAIIEI